MSIRKKSLVKCILLITLVSILLIVIVRGTIIYFTQPIFIGKSNPFQITQYPDFNATLTKEQVQSDAYQMVAFLEQVHPIFLKKKTSQYEQSKREYLSVSQKAMTVSKFRILTSRFLTSLNDGHTNLYWMDTTKLQVNWNCLNGALIIGSGCSLPINSQVVSIGGVPIAQLVSAVDNLMPAENDAAHVANSENYIKYKSILETAGIMDSDSVKISVAINGTVREFDVPYGGSKESSTEQPYVEGKKENGVYIITLRSCELGSELDKTVASLKEAVLGGTNKVIIDVRDNPGGNSEVCLAILNALGMKPGEYGRVIRFSKPASEQVSYLRQDGDVTTAPNNNAIPNKNIQLEVLTNEQTFSSATMLAVWVQDGHLGKIIGQPSGNSPSSYGDIIRFQLNNSRLFGSVSHKQWIRPDITKTNQNELIPDIVVPNDKDALNIAINSFK